MKDGKLMLAFNKILPVATLPGVGNSKLEPDSALCIDLPERNPRT